MILSHKYKFIFIKTTKTAGTSIEVELNKILGPDDVATPIFPVEPGHRPQNFNGKWWGFGRDQYYNHMPAQKVRSLIGKELFRDYFVFCVEREPVDKCISHYSMLRNSPNHKDKSITSFEEYVERGKFPVDTMKYVDNNGELLVDRIVHYERLSIELAEVFGFLGIKVLLEAKAKSGFREHPEVSSSQRTRIYKAFKSSNFHTGYSL